MKKYLQAIPIIIYPYILITMLFLVTILNLRVDITLSTYITITIIYIVLLLILKMKELTEKDMVSVNLVIKLFQLPWFCISFMLEVFGFLMGIFGIPIVVILTIINISVRIINGIYSIGCVIKLRKNKIIGISKTILYSIGSFIIILDFISAIFMKIDVKRINKVE